MMGEENSHDGVCKARKALGDVTNLVGKRGFSSVSGNLGVVNVGNKENGSQIAQKVEKDNFLTKGVGNDKERGKRACVSPRPCSEINSLKGNVISGISKVEGESKEKLQLGSGNTGAQSVIDALRVSCVSSISMPTSPFNMDSLDVVGSPQKDEGLGSQGEESNTISDPIDNSVGVNDENELGDDNLASSKYEESNECFLFPESQESRSSGLEKCVGLNGDGFSNSSAGVDLIKACSCAFCTKAAYIWSDLHYQDIKGRIAALKKSQKEANILVQKCRNKGNDIQDQGKSGVVDLQSSLIDQWRSLFRGMEDILGHESSQLEASLFTLKDLRDNCKTELESINGLPSEKQ